MIVSRHFALVLAAPALMASTSDTVLAPRVGDTYEITLVRDSSQEGNDGSSGSSHDQDTIIERVVGVQENGLELLYDVPQTFPRKQEVKDWKFPARVLLLPSGEMQVLDRPELDARVDKWLKAAKWTRAVCGHWIFTWNAFRIECDPQIVADTVKAFDWRTPNVREGALYHDGNALAPGTITRTQNSEDRSIFVVELEAAPNAVHRARAESDVVVAEILRKPVTFETALALRSKESVKGTISITFETDATGSIRRRTTVTKLQTQKEDGTMSTDTVTQTLERRSLPQAGS